MLDRQEIDLEIAKWEYLESSYDNYAKLAALYTIRDHMTQSKPEPVTYDLGYSSAPADTALVQADGDSEFISAISGRDQSAVWEIMDDLMDTLQVANPRVYNGVMRKIRAL